MRRYVGLVLLVGLLALTVSAAQADEPAATITPADFEAINRQLYAVTERLHTRRGLDCGFFIHREEAWVFAGVSCVPGIP